MPLDKGNCTGLNVKPLKHHEKETSQEAHVLGEKKGEDSQEEMKEASLGSSARQGLSRPSRPPGSPRLSLP